MFGFKKNEKPTLMIEAKDLMEIIKSDYDNDMAFTLIEFSYNEKKYVMGSCVLPANAEECKENISFIFQDRVFESFEEFQTAIIIDNKNILQLLLQNSLHWQGRRLMNGRRQIPFLHT